MMKYLQKLGKSLMLPVAVLPAAALLMGVGYWIDPVGWGANSPMAAFFLKTGAAIIDNIPVLFAVGVAYGLSKTKDGAAALAGLVGFLIVTTLLAPSAVSQLMGIELTDVPVAFGKIANPFTGILSGVIAGELYNKFYKTELPDFLAFFSGKRLVPIITALVMVVVSVILYFIWPFAFEGLSLFGEKFAGLGSIGAGLFGFFNRLLIPVGLHHTLNVVFFFDLIGINDIGRFWGPASQAMNNLPTMLEGIYRVGMYQAGFFPIMMFGLPGAGLAMYLRAKPSRKKAIGSLMLAAGFASFFTGVTEPLEFSFMFLAPILYLIHAILTAISLAVVSALGITAGFGFSAGLVDLFLSLKNPNANKPLLLILIGLIFFVLYFVIFYFAIEKFNIKTPGREDEDIDDSISVKGSDKFTQMADIILIAIGGRENIISLDNCATRLRFELKNTKIVDKGQIKSAGAFGVNVINDTNIQIIIGPKVELVAEELKNML